mgnify:CR=1 FL=1
MSVTISACMIVRDEIDCIEACIDSIAPWVDEVVVVDTGSTDGTWEWVKMRAHKSAQIEWPEHFGQARNASLELATGDWILVVDADERLVKGGATLRSAVARDNLLAAEIRLVNDLGGGATGEFWAVRLFRRDPRIRYTGRIHEQVAGGVRQVMLEEARWQTGRVDLTFAHDGYLPDQFEKKGKAERNVRLLEMALGELSETAPLHQRVYLEYKLSTALGAGPQGQALLGRCAHRLLDANQETLSQVPLAAEILVSASQLWCRTGSGDVALRAALTAARRAPGHPMVALVEAQAHLLLGNTSDAADALARAEEVSVGGFYFDVQGHAAAVAVAKAELAHRSGADRDAIAHLSRAIEADPEHEGLALARVHSLVRAGEPEDALRQGVGFLKAHPGHRGGLLACAAAAEALGMHDRANRWRGMALG